MFQFTLPRGERREGWGREHVGQRVSIHAPAGGATRRRGGQVVRTMSFNSRSRGGSDTLHAGVVEALGVSIHAPAGGATPPPSPLGASTPVSIHAPAGGATRPLRRGARGRQVSIHAPAGGATGSDGDYLYVSKFQFTLPRGERPANCRPKDIHCSFNSRSRGGSDTAGAGLEARHVRFNSRSRGGSDRRLRRGSRPEQGFNSRSRGGSDLWKVL